MVKRIPTPGTSACTGLFYRLLAVLFFMLPFGMLAQQKDRTSSTDTISNYSAYKRKLSFAGVLQTRYVHALTSSTDVDGRNFDPDSTRGITSTFMLKRVRVMVKADINDHFSANILANFAEFSDNPANKVLENAYIRYKLNKYFNLQAGQFRPFFGIEDAVPVDIIRTLDFSNQYYAFGKNGWQSFQVGLSIFGDLVSDGGFRYYAGAYNGNNKNQKTDNNNAKNTYVRLEADIASKITLGANIASGSFGESGIGNAYGIDMTGRIDFSEDWRLLLMAEAKTGTNFLSYLALDAASPASLDDFKMQGFYLLPTLRYDCRNKRLRAIEFSSRYEYFDENYKSDSNARQTLIPNLSLIFADDYYAALQLGVSVDIYKREIHLTAINSHNLAYVQFQVRF